MKGILKAIGFLVIILGFIGGIVAVVPLAQIQAGTGTILLIFIAYAGGGLLCSVMPFAFAEVLGALETITDNQRELPDLLKKQLSLSAAETGRTGKSGEADPRNPLGNGGGQGAAAPSERKNDRSKRLFTNKAYQYGPIVMRKADLLISDNGTALKMEMMNLSEKVITDVKIAVTTMDSVGDVLNRGFEYLYMDLNIGRLQCFGYEQINVLPSAMVRDAQVAIVLVRFSDGTIWKPEGEGIVDFEMKEYGFDYDEYKSVLEGLAGAKEIYEYVRRLNFTDDPVYMEKVLPGLEKIARLERLYGNMKDAALARIKEIYAEE